MRWYWKPCSHKVDRGSIVFSWHWYLLRGTSEMTVWTPWQLRGSRPVCLPRRSGPGQPCYNRGKHVAIGLSEYGHI